MACLKKWAVFVYRKPLLPAWEDEGKDTIMCDRVVQIKAAPRGREYLRVRRSDENFDWVTGADATRKRVRYLPPQVAPGQGGIAQWVQARWIDEMNKNAGDEQYADVMVLYALAGVAEHLCMGLGVSHVSKAVRRIPNPELQWLVRITRRWLARFVSEFPERGTVQKEMWETQRELRVECVWLRARVAVEAGRRERTNGDPRLRGRRGSGGLRAGILIKRRPSGGE